MGKKYLAIIALLIFFISGSASAAFKENYPADNDPVAAPQLRENLNQLWQFTKKFFNPTVSGTTVTYTGGKACFGNNVYTIPDGSIVFSSYTSAVPHYVSIVASGGSASLSVNTGAYSPTGIPLWNVFTNSSGTLTIIDDRTWARNGSVVDPSISGILKASGGVINGAVPGVDYLAPAGDGSQLTGITPAQIGAIPVSAEASAPAPNAIPVADAGGTLNAWVTNPTTVCLPLTGGVMAGPIKGGKQVTFGNVTGTTWNGYIPHSSLAFRSYSANQAVQHYLTPNSNGSQLVGITAAQVGLGNVTNDVQVKRTEMGAASGVATLNAASLVVQNPASATVIPVANAIPIADVSGKLDSWVTDPKTLCLPLAGGIMTGSIKGGQQVTFGNITGATWNGYIPQSTLVFRSYSANQAAQHYLTPTGNGSGLIGITAPQVGLGYVTNDAQVKRSEMGTESGVATLNASALVVQNPANATSTPTANAIPIADVNGKLDNWISPSQLSGRLLSRTILTSGTSYTTPAGCYRIYVQIVGGGGGGGGASGHGTAGGGGGAGGYGDGIFNVTPNTVYSYSIGAGGNGGLNGGNGSGGGSTTFTVGNITIAAFGGSGAYGMSGASQSLAQGGAGGGALADMAGVGGNGGVGIRLSGTDAISGAGGSSIFSSGGMSLSTEGSSSANGYGGGGGGALSINTPASGGNGAPGIIIVWEYSGE